MNASGTLVRVMLPSTNEVVYDVQPQHLNDRDDMPLRERARMFGIWTAVRIGTEWYQKGRGGELVRITDPRACHLLQTLPEAE